MSFNLNELSTYINIKLTDIGRRQLSLGKLRFKKAVVSDREMDYSVDRSEIFDIGDNRILSPFDAQPDIVPTNLDDTPAYTLTSNDIVAAKLFTTARTTSNSFFSASTDSSSLWALNYNLQMGRTNLSYTTQVWDSTTLTYSSTPPANIGDLVWIPWLAPQYQNNAIPAASPLLPSGTPFVSNFYRVVGKGATTLTLDRPIPRFSGVTHQFTAHYYPFNGVETYYGSAYTQDVKVWNLNIARTYDLPGLDSTQNGISGYSCFGAIQYCGTKIYFGFSANTPAVGFIHYTNEMSSSTYGEQLIEGTVQVKMPMLMWHHAPYANGTALAYGQTFYDSYGGTVHDTVAKTTFRLLRDSATSGGTIVGRVYHKLKIIVITDQELLAAMSYKSNRNYTYPDPKISRSPVPKNPLNNSQATGLCKSDYTYFVTYIPESISYSASTSYGLPEALHCCYIKKLVGHNDIHNNPQFLKLEFPANSFPYMRPDSLISSGTGWNANYVQLLISEQPTSKNYQVGNVPPTSWKRISTRAAGGNGIYKASDHSNNTIDPTALNNYTFIISQQDYDSGTTYTLSTGITSGQGSLNFGSESFFFGIVEADFLKATYRSVITLIVDGNHLTVSNNPTFDENLDEYVYVTEVSILDDQNQVVAIGKPTYPIRKGLGDYFAFQLIMDF